MPAIPQNRTSNVKKNNYKPVRGLRKWITARRKRPQGSNTIIHQQSDTMETHAHHLHKAPGEKIWHYVFEFLMLFLAITLGFFVENQREHFIEHRKAKEYAQSLFDDLKVDTLVLQRTIDEKMWILSKYDSVQQVLLSPDLRKEHNELIYYVESYLSWNDVFSTQDVTYRQLLSSGNFRYIKNSALYKKISDYYNLVNRYSASEPGFGYLKRDDLRALEAKLFNVEQLASLQNSEALNFYNLVNRPSRKFDPVKDDPESLRLLYLKVAEAKTQTSSTMLLTWLKAAAVELLNDLQKEYHLE